MNRFGFAGCLAASLVLTAPLAAHAQDSLATARDLYSSASYEDALNLLNRMRAADPRSEEGRAINQYRAFCLLALGRGAEAERAIEAVVTNAPTYRPSDKDMSPRVRSAFVDVRRRMLPAIVQQQYTQAKAAFDQKDFATAAAGFNEVVELASDTDLGPAANQPPLSDLRTLAGGFRDLSVKAAAPPPPPPLPATAPAQAPTPAPAPEPVVRRIYSTDDPGVVMPATIRQTVPSYPAAVVPAGQGVLEIVIDESGDVETATMRMPISPMYDRLVLSAAKNWRYRPATFNGTPVKFRKNIQISLKPTS